MSSDEMNFDVVIVGAGPAGLAAGIRLRQLAIAQGQELTVCILEKGAAVGAHLISGAIMDPGALSSLLPDWQNQGAPVSQLVSSEKFMFLSKNQAYNLPNFTLSNSGCFLVGLGELGRWLAEQATKLLVEIFPGFAAAKLLQNSQGELLGVVTGEFGLDKYGNKKANYQPGVVIKARQTILAEGCRGHLSQQVIKHFQLDRRSQPQCYGLGIKELWEIAPGLHHSGSTIHTIGWPLPADSHGGGFIYHQQAGRVAIGLVMGLEYQAQGLDPFWELQKYKNHPIHKGLFVGGRRIGFGARTVAKGGIQSLPELSFPGGVLVGDGAGMLDVGRIKGIHTAIYSGMLAAEAVFAELNRQRVKDLNSGCTGEPVTPLFYSQRLQESWVWRDLQHSRNLLPGFKWGQLPGLIHGAIDQWLLRGSAPWTIAHPGSDYRIKYRPENFKIEEYQQPDFKLSFDKPSSLYLAAVAHEDNQPNHIKTNFLEPQDHQQRTYCPAGVFDGIITPGNCLHCKTCDIKDFDDKLLWTPPEGGGGPNYLGM